MRLHVFFSTEIPLLQQVRTSNFISSRSRTQIQNTPTSLLATLALERCADECVRGNVRTSALYFDVMETQLKCTACLVFKMLVPVFLKHKITLCKAAIT
jgi:hypothetical protein